MKKQNKFLLTAALVASLVGGYAAQADEAYRNKLDNEITDLNQQLDQHKKALKTTKEAYLKQKEKYSKEVQEIAEKAIKIKESTIADLEQKIAEKQQDKIIDKNSEDIANALKDSEYKDVEENTGKIAKVLEEAVKSQATKDKEANEKASADAQKAIDKADGEIKEAEAKVKNAEKDVTTKTATRDQKKQAAEAAQTDYDNFMKEYNKKDESGKTAAKADYEAKLKKKNDTLAEQKTAETELANALATQEKEKAAKAKAEADKKTAEAAKTAADEKVKAAQKIIDIEKTQTNEALKAKKSDLDAKTATAKEKTEAAQQADKDLAEKTKAAEEANTKLEAAKKAAEAADQADKNAIDAATKATEAATKAENEYKTAKTAYDAADAEKQKTLKADLDKKQAAMNSAKEASQKAAKAKEEAAKANVKAKDEQNNAQNAKTEADKQKTAAVEAQKNAAEAKKTADKEKADAEKAVKDLQDALNKRSKEVYDGLFGDKDDKLKKALEEADKNLDPKVLDKDAEDYLTAKLGTDEKFEPGERKALKLLVDKKIEANKQNIARVEKEYKAADVALGKRIDQLTLDTTKGLAKVAALGSLHAIDYSGNARFNFAVAAASYKSENAVAIGAFYHPNRNVVLSFGTALGDGDNVYSVGASFAFGKSGEPANVSTAELYDMIAALQQKVAELEARK